MDKKLPNAFLLDQVRCGFVVPGAIKQLWAAELEVLAEIDRVCKMHEIEYFADWGTLLGAIRHSGFVPWDDDLDIVMKREDFQKFMTVARFDMDDGFDVQTFHNQKDFWLFMGKVVGKNHFCFEKEHLRRFHNFPYIACVDIFVLDYVYRDPEKEEKRRILCKYILGVADSIVEGKCTEEEREKRLQTIEQMACTKIERLEDAVEMGRYLYSEVEKLFAQVSESEADEMTQMFPYGLTRDRFHFPKEYYQHAVYVPFEHTNIPVPYCFDKMLKLRYGDYMQLIKNAGGHDYPFFEGQKENLLKVLDFPLPEFRIDPRELCRSKEELSYTELSYKEQAKLCVQELQHMQNEMLDYVKQCKGDEALDYLQAIQQLALDMGTLLEQVLDEDSTMIHLLEQFCEDIYQFYEDLVQQGFENTVDCEQRITMSLEAVAKELQEKVLKRKTILFLPVFAKDWGEMKTFWEMAKLQTNCDVLAVSLPYYYKDYDGSPREICCELDDFPEEVHALDYRRFTAEYLELLHPEVIVIQNPYDGWNPNVSVPEMFYSEKIRKYTDKLVYIPPYSVEEFTRENERAYGNLKYYVNTPGLLYADLVLLPTDNIKQLYIERLVEFAGKETRETWEQKLMVLSPETLRKNEDTQSKASHAGTTKILYGLSFVNYTDESAAFLSKLVDNLGVFEGAKEVKVTVCYFPDMEEPFFSLQTEIDRQLALFPSIEYLPYRKCQVEAFDAFYGDSMPIVSEFIEQHKPVLIQKIGLC